MGKIRRKETDISGLSLEGNNLGKFLELGNPKLYLKAVEGIKDPCKCITITSIFSGFKPQPFT